MVTVFLCVSVRSVSAGRGADVSDVGPGPGHSGAVRPPSESLLLSLLPPQRPARPFIPPRSGRRLLLPAGRPPLPPGRPQRSEDTDGEKRQDSWTYRLWRLCVTPFLNMEVKAWTLLGKHDHIYNIRVILERASRLQIFNRKVEFEIHEHEPRREALT